MRAGGIRSTCHTVFKFREGEHILVLLHLGVHWCLLFGTRNGNTFTYCIFDGLNVREDVNRVTIGARLTPVKEILEFYLEKACGFTVESFLCKPVCIVLGQSDHISCGYYVCIAGEHILHDIFKAEMLSRLKDFVDPFMLVAGFEQINKMRTDIYLSLIELPRVECQGINISCNIYMVTYTCIETAR